MHMLFQFQLGLAIAMAIWIPAIPARAGVAEDCASFDEQTALRACSLIIEHGPTRKVDVPMAYFNRGRSYFMDRQFELALADLNAALQLRSDYVEALATRGSTYFALKRFEAAVTDFTSAIALATDRADIYFNRGNALAKLERYDEALRDYKTATTFNPAFQPAWMGIVTIHMLRRDRDNAIAALHKIEAIDPNNQAAQQTLRMLEDK